MPGDLRVRVLDDDVDVEGLDVLTGVLRQELLRLDVEDVIALHVEDVIALPAGEPPPGARVVNGVMVGGLLVALGEAAGALSGVVRPSGNG